MKKTFFKETATFLLLKRKEWKIMQLMLFFLMAGLTQVFAQQKTISGKVTEQSGTPMPGVSVMVKGSSIATTTDIDGAFKLQNVPEKSMVTFTFVGMKKAEIAVEGKNFLTVVMEEEAIGLNEVVAIGYGTVKKSDLSGAVSTLNGANIADRKSAQVSTALQGAIPGVMVTRSSGEPGATASIRIRGITTLSNNDPLVLLDGVPIGSVNEVNANDIENISVLKDAASASIYGARAAAGVILITSKRAKKGEVAMNYNYEYGIEKPTELPAFANAERYMRMINELKWNDGGNIAGNEYGIYNQELIENYANYHAQYPDVYPDTNWADMLLSESAARQTHSLNIAGSSNNIKSRVSFNYDKYEGLYVGKEYERFMIHSSNDIKINDMLSASIDLNAKRTKKESPSFDPTSALYYYAPIYAAVWSNGMIAEGKQGDNVYGRLVEGGFETGYYNQMGGKFSLDFTPLKGLKITGVFAPEFNNNKSKVFTKKVPYTNYDDPSIIVGYLNTNSINKLNETRSDNNSLTTQFFANYTRDFGNHHLNAMGGYENYYYFYEGEQAGSEQLELSTFPYLNLANNNYLTVGGDADENAYRSLFGRIIYDYNQKYLFQANIRYDGSSRFAEEYRWGSFPSFSGGWVVTKESFMEDVPALSYLKLRGSWGRLGNERIGNYLYQANITYGNNLFYQGTTLVSSTTAAQQYYAIKDITWETTESFDFGFDAYFFNNRLRLIGDYYQKTTKDMLLDLEIPDFTGYDNPEQNTGKMHTKGWELELGWNDQIGKLKYAVSANISDFKSEMGDLGGIQFIDDQVKIQGSEFNEWYGYVCEGIYQTKEEVDGSPKISSVVKPGDLRYKDISGPDGIPDGKITPTDDRVLLGGSLPRYMYGGNIRLDYGGFDLSMVFQGVGKQNSRITTAMVKPYKSDWGNMPMEIDGKYWSVNNSPEQNLNARYPRLTSSNANNNYVMSDFWLFNGAYFRMKNITLGYTLPKYITDPIHLQNVRLYCSASDLFSINNYPKGWDPEVSSTGYPITTSIVYGIAVKF